MKIRLARRFWKPARAPGIRSPWTTTRSSRRVSAGCNRLSVTAIAAAPRSLRPALERPNLTPKVKALATRIVFQGTRATGMEYVQRGTTHSAHAAREVILAGGVINTPQLLMLSGI